MKKIYKQRKEDAVSPVIATILMVAITVVLAAVLYVMVIGFGGGGTQAPPGTFTSLSATSTTNATLTFGTFSPAPAPMDTRVILSSSSGEITLSFSSAPSSQDTTMTSSDAGVTATYTDYNYQGNQINSGDFIKVTGLTPNTSYTMKVFYVPADGLCSLTGTTTFSTPA